jgi:hypothetical protein
LKKRSRRNSSGKKGHPARMAPRHTAIDADEPSVAATELLASNVRHHQRRFRIHASAVWCMPC